MRRVLAPVIIVCALVLVSASFYISQFQAITEGVLGTLKLEALPNTTGVIGGPGTYKVTDKTIEHLKKLLKENKHIIAHPDGSITIK
jgi:hypothetical protein